MHAKTVCISHSEDADGLICASFLRRLRDTSIQLVSYDEFECTLKGLKPPVDELFVCDINIREDLLKQIHRIKEFAKVMVVDHHPTAKEALDDLEKSGVSVVYSTLDCASVLLFDHFRDELGREGARLAAYAAISDQFEDGPIASKIMVMFDRHFVQHEALLLAHAISRRCSQELRDRMIDALSRYVFPHRIEGVPEESMAQLDNMSQYIAKLPEISTVLGKLAYVEVTDETPLGTVAGLIIDAIDVDIGVSHKRISKKALNVSLRARRGLAIHLGEVTKIIAKRYGGFGGGHSRASGASIPETGLDAFIRDLENQLKGDAP